MSEKRIIDLSDYEPYAEKLRGKIIEHGPYWSIICRFTKLYDDAIAMQKEIQRLYDLRNMEQSEIEDNFIQTKYGYCYYEIEPGENPIIFNLYVYPQYRRKGQAKKLLQYVINEIRSAGYEGKIDIKVSPRENSISAENLTLFYEEMKLNIINRKPAQVFHPGELIKDEMEARKWDIYWLARKARLEPDIVKYLIEEKINISEYISFGLSRAFGTSKELWINLQNQYDEWMGK